jgi:NADH-ubiquinone oxidoreductase chain 4
MNFFLRSYVIINLIFFCLLLSFSCLSVFLFYVIFEFTFMLIYIFLLSWGFSSERLGASFYIVFYTILVSFPFLTYIILFDTLFLSIKFISIYIYEINNFWWIFLFLVFLVKLPVYGVHLWLPKAHVESPISGSIVLAGVLLKIGGYGIIRISFLCSSKLIYINGYLVSIGLMGSLIRCFLCIRQYDLKSLVAYSSVCHMGLFLAGIFSFSFWGENGRVYIIVSHGFCSSCLFYIVYVLYKRFHSRRILLIKGIYTIFPSFIIFIFIFSIFNMGLPPSISFFSEVSILVGVLIMNFFRILLIMLILFFSGVYCIFIFISISHGNSVVESLNFPISPREYLNVYNHTFPLIIIPVFLNFFY